MPRRFFPSPPWRRPKLTFSAAFGLLLLFGSARAADEAPDPETINFVRDKVQPLLVARCYACHGPDDERTEDEPGGGLLLNGRNAALTGGESGPAIVPGKPDESLLLSAVLWKELEMPPDTLLPEGEIAILRRWIELGAPWPDDEELTVFEKKKFPLAERQRDHWCWQPLSNPTVPEVTDADWPRNTVDRFIAAAHDKNQLHPAPDADRKTLIRRMSFALIGLPPTPDEVDNFINDPADIDAAIAKLADRLLASPHFGERWARHWLDLMRYAESRGHEYDYDTPNPWHYRDYVIRALNDDVPFDQFFLEHLAGDLLTNPRTRGPGESNESILATGFWYLGDWIHSPTDIRADEMDRIDNQIDVFGRAFLGLTIACSRCHDHKFDAISSADYYALAGYLQSSSYRQVRFETMRHNGTIAEKLWQLRFATLARLGPIWTQTAEMSSGEDFSARVSKKLLRAAEAIRGGIRDGSGLPLADRTIAPWVDELQTARNRSDHVLHAFATAATQTDAPQNAVAHWKQSIVALRETAAARAIKQSKSTPLCDYEHLPTAAWRQDGHAFGPGPVDTGEMFIAGSTNDPQLRVATTGSARHDLRWPSLSLARGTQEDPGFLEDLKRSGRTLKTETFAIDGPLHYLVKGKGRLQIVVASHRMIKGPLHEALIRSFDTGKSWQWVTADIDRYTGERAHIELVPDAGEACQLRRVVSGEKPAPPATPGETATLWLDSRGDPSSLQALAELYARGLTAAIGNQNRQSEQTEKDVAASAALVDWAISQPYVLPTFFEAAKETLTEHATREAALLADVARESATAIAIWDSDSEDEHLLLRGSTKKPGDLVRRRNLEALGGEGPNIDSTGSGRLALAGDLIRTDRNPLLSRVIVNRLWHHLFGRGIVRTVDNFGKLGEPPSHPQLLDHIAHEFAREGWSLKTLIHKLVTSRTYRMASNERAASVDPENIFLSHMPIRRLEGEAIRDAILTISGRLNPTLGGPSVPIHLTKFTSGRGRPNSGPLDGEGRRSIYLAIRRNFLSPMMLVFDTPIPFNPVGRRNRSNVPAQPLTLMNDPFVSSQAARWAQRILAIGKLNLEERINLMYRDAFAREARSEEISQGLAFMKAQAAEYALERDDWEHSEQVWRDYAHVLINTKEFIFLQ